MQVQTVTYNTNTTNTYVWLKYPEGGAKYLKGVETIVYPSYLVLDWGWCRTIIKEAKVRSIL